MASKGGARPGAGRPRKDEQTKPVAKVLEESIDAHFKSLQGSGVTREVLHGLTLRALANVQWHIERGNEKVAMWFLDRFQPTEAEPDWEDEVRQATAEEIEADLILTFEAMGLDHDTAGTLVAGIRNLARQKAEAEREAVAARIAVSLQEEEQAALPATCDATDGDGTGLTDETDEEEDA